MQAKMCTVDQCAFSPVHSLLVSSRMIANTRNRWLQQRRGGPQKPTKLQRSVCCQLWTMRHIVCFDVVRVIQRRSLVVQMKGGVRIAVCAIRFTATATSHNGRRGSGANSCDTNVTEAAVGQNPHQQIETSTNSYPLHDSEPHRILAGLAANRSPCSVTVANGSHYWRY